MEMTDEELCEALEAIPAEELSAPVRLVVEGLRRVLTRQESTIEDLRRWLDDAITEIDGLRFDLDHLESEIESIRREE